MRIHSTFRSALVVSAALGFTLTTTGCNSDSKDDAGSVRPASPATSASPAASANGIEKQSAQKILAAARKATASAATLRIKGQIKEGGQAIALDFSYSGKESATGELTMDGQRVALTRIGSAVYVKPDDKFLQKLGGKAAVQTLAGKYLKTKPGDKDFADIATFTTLPKVVNGILTAEGTPAKGEVASLEGRPAIALTDGGKGKLYVSTVGEPYALRIDGGADGRIDFLDYGKAVTVQAPPSNQVVDVSGLKGAGG
ncbi:hypothetical protein [Actinomadura rudentiformis]|uniref:LppX_LprAFG lipoprotein n=1 Tax=Actinomadura rudentiformis TaxID=359158 RepID=A0A6H9YIX3_9ACTN|nr:hypothetical protein [Actinomadura rudentiformis]KAB2346025.1 hypothetical protein F8566_25255 [Actinomadura rudentiformis]